MAAILNQITEVCIFRVVETGPQYLLLQRAAGDKLYPGLWQIMTGTIRRNETAAKAALRELEEETGLPVKRFWTAPVIDSFFNKLQDAVQLVPVFAVEIDAINNCRLSKEHQNCEWLDYSSARERIVWPGQRNVIDIVHEFITGGKEAARLLEIKQL